MAGVSFAESSFFPLPPDVMLVPMCLAEPKKLWWYTNVCAVASLLGGLVGYAIGFYLFESVGRWIFDLYDLWASYHSFSESFNALGPWFLILKGITPIPYKLLAIMAGIAQMDLLVFVLCSVVARFSRYYLIAVLLHFYGPQVQQIIEKRLMLVTTLVLVIVVGGLLSFKFV
ncbi:YqaA family protein [Azospirillum sp. ST 5-10]|uniref:YqaA family protein n=1 Tax=unclassified Azospirillum TaxID=2630922 RepID=UPI003F4A5126